MKVVMLRFAIFMTLMPFMYSVTAAYGIDLDRIWKQVQNLEEDVYFVRKDIKTLFDKTDQLNMSAVEDCGRCIFDGNKTSCPPVINHGGRQRMTKVNSDTVLVKYRSLINAFVSEKKITRELKGQLRSVEARDLINTERDKGLRNRVQSMANSITAKERIADERYRELISRLQSISAIDRRLESRLQAIEIISAETDREIVDRLQSMDGTISDIRKSITLMSTVSELRGNKRDRKLQSRLRSMEQSIDESISDIYRELHINITLMNKENETLAYEKDREIKSRLQSVEDVISAIEKVANDRYRSMRESIEDKIADIYRDLHDNMTSFMTTISRKIDEHLLKVETISVKPDVSTVPIVNTNCRTVPDSGVYTINLGLSTLPLSVYCDQDTDGGGWIVFMRRQDGSVNFTRSWSDYKHGFGSPDGEFWAGNEFLYKMTKAKPLKLRIDMEDFDGNTTFAVYEKFQVGTEEDKYRLHVTGYSGTAGDSLIDTTLWCKHAGMQFTTFDSDNDNLGKGNCAEAYKVGWWYNDCFCSILTGPYSHDENIWADGIIWSSWKGWKKSLKHVEMKLR